MHLEEPTIEDIEAAFAARDMELTIGQAQGRLRGLVATMHQKRISMPEAFVVLTANGAPALMLSKSDPKYGGHISTPFYHAKGATVRELIDDADAHLRTMATEWKEEP